MLTDRTRSEFHKWRSSQGRKDCLQSNKNTSVINNGLWGYINFVLCIMAVTFEIKLKITIVCNNYRMNSFIKLWLTTFLPVSLISKINSVTIKDIYKQHTGLYVLIIIFIANRTQYICKIFISWLIQNIAIVM